MSIVDGAISTNQIIDAHSSADVLRDGSGGYAGSTFLRSFAGTNLAVLILGLRNRMPLSQRKPPSMNMKYPIGSPFESFGPLESFQLAKYMSRGCLIACSMPHSMPFPGWGLSFTLRVEISPSSFARPANSSCMDFSFEARVFASQSPIQLSALSDSYIL